MSQYEMQECHVDLEQAGPPDDDETLGMHNITLLVVALVEEILKCDHSINVCSSMLTIMFTIEEAETCSHYSAFLKK